MSTLFFALTLGIGALELKVEQIKPNIVLANEHTGSVSTLIKKQSILIDKIYKEKLSIARGIDSKTNRVALKKNIVLFEKVLNGLMEGDADLALLGTENKKLLKQLKVIKKLWMPFKANILHSKFRNLYRKKFRLLKNINKSIKIDEISRKKDKN